MNEFEQFIGFQWDEGNIDKNLLKHQVHNWECEQIFFNEPLIILDDPKHSLSEKRWAAFGQTDAGRLLTIIFTKRDKLLRVISARDMNRKEKKFYEKSD
ncbi:MAG: BrnT family toxin [Deltaproteobacteria bacterium]|nr:BrnT family toxin [Deltaproteobacteria bacterium]MBW1958837.1 BrnT family toxin [Deltaproteobacteria bacterium]MBW2014052.1 BrnT family toxin [Deltaproteobacteria bacterium]MBW2089401.1 BrnT family toxin [Deltaproteobacteria bacterium]MBW2320054.1 BrnT family toxin [Deltaproteobacteria bacterium]